MSHELPNMLIHQSPLSKYKQVNIYIPEKQEEFKHLDFQNLINPENTEVVEMRLEEILPNPINKNVYSHEHNHNIDFYELYKKFLTILINHRYSSSEYEKSLCWLFEEGSRFKI